MRKFILIMLTILSVLCLPVRPVMALTEPPAIVGVGGVVIDAELGTVLFDKFKDEKLEPASTTKVMTALLTLEKLDLDKKVIIDEETSFTPGSRIYLLEGEEVTVDQLLHALLIESANDAALALAKEISGSVEEFAKLMNQRAKELGAENTNFVNPHGLHQEGHLSTAYDLALIAREAMKNPVFREYVLTYQYTIPATNKQPTRYLYNTNRLIYDGLTKVDAAGVLRPAKYEGATGIKTGYTPEAGGCLVASASRDGSEFISVVLKSTDLGRFGDSIALLDFAFANYKSVVAVKAGDDMGTIPVRGGAVRQATLVLERDGGVTLPREASEEIVTTKTILDEKIKAPVTKGQKIGVVEVYEGDVLRDQVPIIASEEVPQGTILSYVGVEDETAFKVFFVLKILGAVLGALIVTLLLYILIRKQQIRKKKRLRQKRLMELAKERNVRY